MPFKVFKDGDQYCVKNIDTGESKGCSDTREKAQGHMRALYAAAGAEAKTKSMDPWDLYGAQYTQTEANYNPVGGDNDKACSNCRWFSSPDGCLLVSGDIAPNGVSNLWAAIPAYEVQPIPVEIVNKEDTTLFNKVKEWVTNIVKPTSSYKPGIILTKENDRLRFIMPYTNNFQDKHFEIFARESHKEFEQWADKNNTYPEVWMWHVPGTRWGQVDYVAIDESPYGAFGVVSGLVDLGMEHVAKSFADDPDIGVSHSCWVIQKGDTIEQYYTYEVSPLPAARAANTLHEGVKLLEDTMAIDPTKRAWLVEHAGEGFVTTLEKDLESRAAAAQAGGVKSKEEAPPPPTEPTTTESTTPPALTLETIQAAFQEAITPLQSTITTLNTEIADLKLKQKGIDERAAELFAGPVMQEGYIASKEAPSNATGQEKNVEFEWMKNVPGAFALNGGE